MSGLKHISVAQDGTILGVRKSDGKIFQYFSEMGAENWVEDKTAFADVVAAGGFDKVWCVNSQGQIYVRNPDSGAWTLSEGAATHAKTISAGSDGTVWYSDSAHNLFSLVLGDWSQAPGAGTLVAVGGKNNVWSVDTTGHIHKWVSGAWIQDAKASNVMSLSVASDGTAWCVNTSQQIFQQKGANWEQVPGAAAVVAVGSKDSVWVVDKDGNVFQHDDKLANKWRRAALPAEAGHANWTYTVTANDKAGLNAVVMREYKVADPTALVKQVKALNPGLNADHIQVGQHLTMPPK